MTALYRMFDADGRLLYVGITIDIVSRFRDHRSIKPWWPDIQTIQLEHFPDRPAARAAELKAITTEFPCYNVADTVRRRTPRTAAAVAVRAQTKRELDEATAELHEAIVDDLDDGHAQIELAKLARVSRERIRLIANDVREKRAQPSG